MQVGFRRFKWLTMPSAYQSMKNHRLHRAEAIKRHLNMMDGINAALANAQQNQISGMSSNAAQTALARLQAAAKAKSAEITKGIDAAQSLVDQTKAVSAGTSGNSNVLDTIA
jgi:alcohol dehydrogenase YqhD (iron-dependent ADH family)